MNKKKKINKVWKSQMLYSKNQINYFFMCKYEVWNRYRKFQKPVMKE